MPKLLQINVCSAMLSTGKIAEDISKVAIKHGWTTYTAWGRFAKSSVSTQIRIGSKFDTYIHYIAHKLFDYEGLASKRATRKLIYRIKEIKPNIIHLHNIHDHYINYPILFDYLAKSNIPIVWTLHDCWTFTGGCMYYDQLNCYKWETECKECQEHRALFNDTTEKQYALKRDLLAKINHLYYVPVSNWLADALSKSHQKVRPSITIHNGIDLSIFKPIQNKTRTNYFQILGVAAVWDKRKGLDDFIRLRKMLPSEYKITLVGLNSEQIKSLPKEIHGITRTTNVHELVQLYSFSDVFVNPTYSDNFPTTNIEAIACGTPVITYNTGGSPEAIDEKTGIVIEQGNIIALANAIINMKEHPLSSKDCRLRAEKYFDKDKCFEKYMDLYNNLLQK